MARKKDASFLFSILILGGFWTFPALGISPTSPIQALGESEGRRGSAILPMREIHFSTNYPTLGMPSEFLQMTYASPADFSSWVINNESPLKNESVLCQVTLSVPQDQDVEWILPERHKFYRIKSVSEGVSVGSTATENSRRFGSESDRHIYEIIVRFHSKNLKEIRCYSRKNNITVGDFAAALRKDFQVLYPKAKKKIIPHSESDSSEEKGTRSRVPSPDWT